MNNWSFESAFKFHRTPFEQCLCRMCPNQCGHIMDWKISPILSKVAQKGNHSSFWLNVMFLKYPDSHQTFGLLLKDNLSPRTFKNRRIWSHWSQWFFSLEKLLDIFFLFIFLKNSFLEVFGRENWPFNGRMGEINENWIKFAQLTSIVSTKKPVQTLLRIGWNL